MQYELPVSIEPVLADQSWQRVQICQRSDLNSLASMISFGLSSQELQELKGDSIGVVVVQPNHDSYQGIKKGANAAPSLLVFIP